MHDALGRSEQIVYLVSNDERKARIKDSLEGLQYIIERDTQSAHILAPNLNVLSLYLPASSAPTKQTDTSPDHRSRGWLARISELCRSLSQTQWRAIVLSPEDLLLKWPAVSQKTRQTTPGTARQARDQWTVGTTIPREDIVEALDQSGYIFVPKVAHHSDVSIRGNIIDLFPLDMQYPVRIEFDGDQIESLREFDPNTQRSIAAVEQLRIEKTTSPFAKRELSLSALNGLADTLNIPSRTRRLLFSKMQNTSIDDAVAGQLPAWFPDEYDTIFKPMWSQFGDTVRYMFDDRETFLRRFSVLTNNLNSQYDHATGIGELIFSPMDVAVPTGQLESWLTTVVCERAPSQDNPDIAPFEVLKSACIATKGDLDDLVATLRAWTLTTPAKTLFMASASTRVHEHIVDIAKAVNDQALEPTMAPEDASQPTRRQVIPSRIEAFKSHLIGDGPLTATRWLLRANDIFRTDTRRRGHRKQYDSSQAVHSLAELTIGSLVVHKQHGIGRYDGLQTVEAAGTVQDYLKIVYTDNNRLYVPAYNIDLVCTYLGGDTSTEVLLDRLGGSTWSKKKQAAKEDIAHLAERLLRVQAQRLTIKRTPYTIDRVEDCAEDNASYSAFANRFEHVETTDQTSAIEALIDDLLSSSPMNRIICGDVGFGKTEVAMRAAFIVAYNGKQVAILAPTTLLTEQHYRRFSQRFVNTGLKVARLCGLDSKKEQIQRVEDLANGKIDIVVGTHRLLSKDIRFKDLGLLVVDEEHRFGVKQKELIKSRTHAVDQLYLSATPIPRTMQSGLTGLQSISRLTIAPSKRKRIHTRIIDRNNQKIRHILSSELRRGGQVYVVHNRVSDIEAIRSYIAKLAPSSRIGVIHGQMDPKRVEITMIDFVNRDLDILVATSIIESGIDIDTANTMIINNAHQFGLSQLHQLRGRVGRSETQAYCYLICSEIRREAEQSKKRSAYSRLVELTRHDALGSGMQSRLEILKHGAPVRFSAQSNRAILQKLAIKPS